MTTKKYEILRDQTMEHAGRTLYRWVDRWVD
jgi:hypothetical protein